MALGIVWADGVWNEAIWNNAIWAQEASPDDTVPDAFSLVRQTGVALSTLIESNIITVTGINASTAISVVNGSYRINGGSYTTSPGTVVNGDTVQVSHTSSGSELTTVGTTLIIGGESDTFESVTLGSGSGERTGARTYVRRINGRLMRTVVAYDDEGNIVSISRSFK